MIKKYKGDGTMPQVNIGKGTAKPTPKIKLKNTAVRMPSPVIKKMSGN